VFFLGCEVADNSLARVGSTRPPDLKKISMEQLFQPIPTAPDPRVVEFDFERLEEVK
jgi:hypothetical protein